jgi:hypothetical protein
MQCEAQHDAQHDVQHIQEYASAHMNSFDLQFLFDCYPIRECLMKYFANRDLFVLQFVFPRVQLRWPIRGRLTRAWYREGHLELIKWAHKLKYRDTYYHLAAEYGHKHILKWLVSRNARMEYGLIAQHAAKGGHRHILKWAVKKYPAIREQCEIISYAASGGHANLTRELISDNLRITSDTFREVARLSAATNSKTLLVLLKEYYGAMHPAAIVGAAAAHYPQSYQLSTLPALVSDDADDEPAEIAFLKWIRTEIFGNRQPKDYPRWSTVDEVHTLDCANVRILEWFVSGGYVVGLQTFKFAASRGDTAILDYLKSIQSMFNYNALYFAAAARQRHNVTLWLLQNKPAVVGGGNALEFAAEQGDAKALKYLLKWGVDPTDDTVCDNILGSLVRNKRYNCILYLCMNKRQFSARLVEFFYIPDKTSERTMQWLRHISGMEYCARYERSSAATHLLAHN